jgi:predicted MFS family arabinose efflux permease
VLRRHTNAPSPGVSPDARLLLAARGIRSLADGLISLVLPAYLVELGYGAWETGTIATATLVGSAVLTLAVGLHGGSWPRRMLLMGAAVLMLLTGLGFIGFEAYWPLLLIAFLGTLNPSSGDVSVFLPLEQAELAQLAPDQTRTRLFARYSFVGSIGAAAGALMVGLPDGIDYAVGISREVALKSMFGLYACAGLAAFMIYRSLPQTAAPSPPTSPKPLSQSRSTVLTLAALFSLDAFGGGLVVQSLLALWLYQRFGLSLATTGALFFWFGVLSAFSYFAAAWISERIGLVNTMVFTHLPANLCLALAPFAPDLQWTLTLLLIRSALSQMDVPTRTSFVMSVVSPEERAAAASVTAVPRSLASALGPMFAGALLTSSAFGWPLVMAGSLKATYDLLLLIMFRNR